MLQTHMIHIRKVKNNLANRLQCSTRIEIATTTGVVQSVLGGVTLSNPTAVTVDRMGNVLIADTGAFGVTYHVGGR
jgi:hypothetical protein